MKITFYSSLIFSLFFGAQSVAMVGQSITKQDQIMNQAMKAISFEDVVRNVEMLDDGSLNIIFQKHAAIYTLDAVKAEGFLKTLEQSKSSNKKVKISVLPDNQKVIHVE